MNAQGGIYRNALQAAAFKGNLDVVRLLLREGADVNAQGGKYRNVLQAAVARGELKVERWLLLGKADVDDQNGSYRNALRADLKAIRLLLQEKAAALLYQLHLPPWGQICHRYLHPLRAPPRLQQPPPPQVLTWAFQLAGRLGLLSVRYQECASLLCWLISLLCYDGGMCVATLPVDLGP